MVTDCSLGSTSYHVALEDLKLLFPHGLCCTPCFNLLSEGIHCPAVGVTLTATGCKLNMSSGCDKQHFVGDFSGELKQCGADIDYCNVRNIEQSAIWIVNRPQSFIQTMCVVIPPQLMLERNSGNTLQPVYVDMIRGFLACGFCPVAMKMIWFSEKEAKELSEMMQVDMKVTW